MSEVLMRSAVSGTVALAVSLLIGPPVIGYLRRLKYGQVVRTDGPASHLKKSGTPSMGGVIMLAAVVIGAVSGSRSFNELPWALFITTGCGLIGMADDYVSVVAHRSLGLRARHKLLLQGALGIILGMYAYASPNLGSAVIVPFTHGRLIDLGIWKIPFVALVLISATNGVNLTDGLDGLAGGTVAVASFAYLAVARSIGNAEMAVFAGAVGGACLGFVWWNAYPARVFMGDTGSLALGAALACMAVLTKTEFILVIIGGVYVMETLSDIIQVASFRLTGKRVFRMAPIHHHFELSGVPETQVVVRFWIVAAFFGVLGFMAL
ncbi:MAG: phospho-N-acetylmuramoyl-pentapeptide-transferase [Clostridia bacterium]|nr:phospho-N-acetylmuramoyl-pentapeptide-transferase [Clostridia bacterium]